MLHRVRFVFSVMVLVIITMTWVWGLSWLPFMMNQASDLAPIIAAVYFIFLTWIWFEFVTKVFVWGIHPTLIDEATKE